MQAEVEAAERASRTAREIHGIKSIRRLQRLARRLLEDAPSAILSPRRAEHETQASQFRLGISHVAPGHRAQQARDLRRPRLSSMDLASGDVDEWLRDAALLADGRRSLLQMLHDAHEEAGSAAESVSADEDEGPADVEADKKMDKKADWRRQAGIGGKLTPDEAIRLLHVAEAAVHRLTERSAAGSLQPRPAMGSAGRDSGAPPAAVGPSLAPTAAPPGLGGGRVAAGVPTAPSPTLFGAGGASAGPSLSGASSTSTWRVSTLRPADPPPVVIQLPSRPLPRSTREALAAAYTHLPRLPELPVPQLRIQHHPVESLRAHARSVSPRIWRPRQQEQAQQLASPSPPPPQPQQQHQQKQQQQQQQQQLLLREEELGRVQELRMHARSVSPRGGWVSTPDAPLFHLRPAEAEASAELSGPTSAVHGPGSGGYEPGSFFTPHNTIAHTSTRLLAPPWRHAAPETESAHPHLQRGSAFLALPSASSFGRPRWTGRPPVLGAGSVVASARVSRAAAAAAAAQGASHARPAGSCSEMLARPDSHGGPLKGSLGPQPRHHLPAVHTRDSPSAARAPGGQQR